MALVKTFYLQAIEGPLAPRRWMIESEKSFIGRDPKVCLQACFEPARTSVSKIHASVRRSDDGKNVILCDEGSKLGTFVEEIGRIASHIDFLLSGDDTEFWVGDDTLRFRIEVTEGVPLDHETTRQQAKARGMTESDFAALLDGARMRKNAHIGRLHQLYGAKLGSKLRRKYPALSHDTITDLVSDTFVALPQLLIWYEERGKFEGWLFEVARNVARTRQRSNQRYDNKFEDTDSDGARDASAVIKLETSDLVNLLERMIRELSPKACDVMTMHFEGRSSSEIASLLGRTTGAIDTALSRAKVSLARIIGFRELIDMLGIDGTIYLVGIDRLFSAFGEEAVLESFGAKRLVEQVGLVRMSELFGSARVKELGL